MTLREHFSFLKKTLSRKREIGAITMSSGYVVSAVRSILPEQFSTVVEYGPGSGVMTQALLEQLAPDGKILAIESNKYFVSELQRISDRRLRVIQHRMQEVTPEDTAQYKNADVVVSSIPFSFLSESEQLQVVKDMYALLSPGGLCVIFHQYSRRMQKPLEEVFGDVMVLFEARNVPPCFILYAKKGYTIGV